MEKVNCICAHFIKTISRIQSSVPKFISTSKRKKLRFFRSTYRNRVVLSNRKGKKPHIHNKFVEVYFYRNDRFSRSYRFIQIKIALGLRKNREAQSYRSIPFLFGYSFIAVDFIDRYINLLLSKLRHYMCVDKIDTRFSLGAVHKCVCIERTILIHF